MRRLFTSESVTEGHPDKICDQISDSVLDAILKEDKNARVACETAVNTGLVLVMGEITTNCYVDIAKTARKTIRDIGFTRAIIIIKKNKPTQELYPRKFAKIKNNPL